MKTHARMDYRRAKDGGGEQMCTVTGIVAPTYCQSELDRLC